MILETIKLLKKLKSLNNPNPLMKEPVQHIQEILNKTKNRMCFAVSIMKKNLSMKILLSIKISKTKALFMLEISGTILMKLN